MQFTYAAIAAALVASVAAHANETVVWVTKTETDYTTYCPASAAVTYGESTYTNTATVGIIITVPCPGGCVHTYPVTTSAVTVCTACAPAPTTAPVYANTTVAAPTTVAPAPTTPIGTIGSTPAPTTAFAAGATNLAAGSALSLAGLMGLVAYIL